MSYAIYRFGKEILGFGETIEEAFEDFREKHSEHCIPKNKVQIADVDYGFVFGEVYLFECTYILKDLYGKHGVDCISHAGNYLDVADEYL